MKFSNRLDSFSEYVFSRLNKEKALIEQETGQPVLDLGAGSPDIPPSPKYVKKLQEFFASPNAHRYPGYGAIPEFSEALTKWYKQRFTVELKNGEIFPLIGAKDAVSHINLALLDTGDELLVPDPGYPAYTSAAQMIEANPIPYYPFSTYEVEKGGLETIDFSDLERKVTDKTKFIWANFPSNPTGATVTLADLKKLVNIAKKHQVWLVYDNAYSEITFDGYVAPSILEVEGAGDVAVEIGSLSKTFSFAGFRIGYVVGNRKIIGALAKVKSVIDSGMPKPFQQLAAFALTHPDQKWHDSMIASYQNNREIIAKYLREYGLTFDLPKGGLYIWAKVPGDFNDSVEFTNHLLRNKRILVTPGTAFGPAGNKYIRASICTDTSKIGDYK